ncbi:hypothetical protein Q9L58_000056 [Maublancomyces gigas]|uniref:Kinetochore protein SPC25 n=1 Tax=Discina gigas TaxID=1032678 RepID=A0ABR3GY84_9PEZI
MATPPPPPPPPAALPALHTQLASLEREKTRLTTQLLSLRASRPVASASATASTATTTTTTTTPPLSDSQILSHVFASSTTNHAAARTRLHRIAGITTFAVRDPSPPHEKLLGIRIEVFAERTFRIPHYILLSLPDTSSAPKSGTFTIHRHTLPPFLPLARLSLLHARSLSAFVRALRRAMLLHARREAAAMKLKRQALAAAAAAVEDVEWDAEVALVTVTWGNGSKAWIRVGEEGDVGKVVVVGGSGGRERGLERKIVGGGLEGVAGRMGW